MNTSHRSARRQALLAAIVLGLSATAAAARSAGAEPAPAPTVAPGVAAAYVHPHRLVAVERGRRMNLYCLGHGRYPVVFDSGLSDWSSIWALIQPVVAKRTEACTYDRPGMGYSDLAQRPSTPSATIADLHALLRKSGVRRPVVLVGHSLGGFNMKLYAATYPADVAGVVLVDPSEERMLERSEDLITARYGAAVAKLLRDGLTHQMSDEAAQFATCAKTARAADLDPASALYKACTDPVRPPLGPVIAAERQRLQVRYAYQAGQASEIANGPFGSAPAQDAGYAKIFAGEHPLGDKPLIVLTRGVADMPEPGYFAWSRLHDMTARLSTHGRSRTIAGTHHNIEVDKPEAIVEAIGSVLDELGAP